MAVESKRCDDCYEVTLVGRAGDIGTEFASHWYCERCWKSWNSESLASSRDGKRVQDSSANLLRAQTALCRSLEFAAERDDDNGAVLFGSWRRFVFASEGGHQRPKPHSREYSHGRKLNATESIADALKPQLYRLWDDVLHRILQLPKSSSVHNFECYFSTLASSGAFRELWAGTQRGPFLLPSTDLIKGSLSLSDVLHGLSMRPTNGLQRKPCEMALTLTDGDDFRCPIGLPPISNVHELLQVLQYGTVFLNTASLHWRCLAEICLAASSVLQFPTNINVYITGRGRRVSTDVHTDNHDVLILHTEGAKRWQVFEPPLRRSGMAHPLYRGKNEDKLESSELGEPLLDVVLRPGEVLFVPMGFPHATSTIDTGETDVSVHVTLGLSTADYGLCLGGLRQSLLEHLGQESKLNEPYLNDNVFWKLWCPVPVGCLVPNIVREAKDPKAALLSWISLELHSLLLGVERNRWIDLDDELLYKVMKRVIAVLLERQLLALQSQEEAYREVSRESDGIFLSTGPGESASDYRRSMLEHQAAEDLRKRRRVEPNDERFVKRIDPADGVARTKPEIKELYSFTNEKVEEYWTSKCNSIYPGDRPPEDLVDELERAGETCEALLHFLRKRTPHLHTDHEQAPHTRPSTQVYLSHRSSELPGCLEAQKPKIAKGDHKKFGWASAD
eukprot:TRINITY_DN31103_c0_g1_i1.p1 TRINITY_DN31103_c0_g1~~TRINITY_DN31103_c0_g1_i1.p1  ORF type:complete len:703 (-),score=101.71 TRINITY_DN31103_c0_g1_i1:134-2158(-)